MPRSSPHLAKVRELAERNQRLEDRLRRLETDVADARRAADEAQTDARDAYRRLVDYFAERTFGVGIYGTPGPKLPEQAPNPEQLESFNHAMGRRRSRDIVRAAEAEFNRALAAVQNPQTAQE